MLYLQFLLCIIYLKFTSAISFLMQNYNLKITMTKLIKIEHTILDQCFSNNTEQNLIFTNWSHYNYNYLLKSRDKPIYLMGMRKTVKLDFSFGKIKRYLIYFNDTYIKPLPINKFLIAQIDRKSLELSLHTLKRSSFWNIDGFFLISNVHESNSCNNADFVLRKTWNFSILSAVFLCQDIDFKIRLYTFSPYSEKAPKFWKKVRRIKEKNGHYLTLFINAQKIISDVTFSCENLWFDKTHDLDGYPIPIAAAHQWVSYRDKSSGELKKVDTYKSWHEVFKIIWKNLKANCTFTYFPTSQTGGIDSHGIANGVTSKVLSGKYEMRAGKDRQRGLAKNELNSLDTTGFCFVTKKEHYSIVYHLSEKVHVQFFCSFIIIIIGIVILFKHMIKLDYLTIGIDILRGVVGVSMMHQPKFPWSKFIFMWFVFSFMIVTNYLQSLLLSMLTVPMKYDRDITSHWDLINHGYKIYSRIYLKQFFHDTPIYKNNLTINEISECLDLIEVDATAACIEFCSLVKIVLSDSDAVYRTSIYSSSSKNYIFLFRDDFPLRDRISLMNLRLFECGIPNYLKELYAVVPQTKDLSKFEVLSLDQLYYILYSSVALYLFDICVFMVESNKLITVMIRETKKKLNKM